MSSLNKSLIFIAVTIYAIVGVAHFALAADPVQITVTGNVVATPCEVTADSKSMNIDLGQGSDLQTADLNAAGSSSDWVPFTIALENCPAGTSNVTATFHGTADADDAASLYSNTGTATKVAVQLEGVDSTPYGNGKTSKIDIASSAASWKLQTRAFSKAGGVTPGTISSVITMSFDYN